MAPWRLLGELGRGARYTFRLLVRRPGFAVIALLTLALGTGATTAIFTVLYNALLCQSRSASRS